MTCITSCSANYNGYVSDYIRDIETSREQWITTMEERLESDTIDQNILKQEFFDYERMDLHRGVLLLKSQYGLDTEEKEIKDLLLIRRELTRMFYYCDGLPMTRDKLSKLIIIENEINSFLLRELKKVES